MTGSAARPELADADRIAREAGALLLSYRERVLTVDTKMSSSDPVSEADRDSEAHIVRAIAALYPGDSIVGEEGASIVGSTGRRWIIDPLDGTVNYLYGRSEWAVSIALWEDDRPLVGIVYQPAKDLMYTASAGEGARRNGELIHVNDPKDLSVCLVVTGFSYEARLRKEQASELALLLPSIRDIRRGGSSALDMCSVADGQADLYLERYVRSWDIAAGHVIVLEAGGTVNMLSSEKAYVGVLAGAAGPVSAVEQVLNA